MNVQDSEINTTNKSHATENGETTTKTNHAALNDAMNDSQCGDNRGNYLCPSPTAPTWANARQRRDYWLSFHLEANLHHCPTLQDTSVADLKQLWDTQQGKCAVTGLPMTFTGRASHYDVRLIQRYTQYAFETRNCMLVCRFVQQMRLNQMTANQLYYWLPITSALEAPPSASAPNEIATVSVPGKGRKGKKTQKPEKK